MNWQNLLQTGLNGVLQLGLAYLAAWSTGMSNRQALGAAVAAITTGQVALHQTAPKDQAIVDATLPAKP